MRKATMLLAALVATGLIAAGCGDDDDGDDGNGGEALTEQEFITQADQICTEGDADIEAQEDEFFGQGEPSQAQVEEYATEVLVPGIQSQIDGIRGLEAPEEIEGEVNEFLDTAQAALDEVEQDPSLIGPGPEAEDPFAETERLGRDLGLTVCAQ